ncbi:MAG TPA: nuclease-related domain-containing protein [Methanocorpusculum sp.]|nr:nuclease-related domain-containing protein [Methanocorpusculum sp.]HJJ40514.1 nuclease-related domain-containing protein [Methanocorpusculum sp.]HJJ49869.1 nuclease-related domain-containing protein [Methanocorpusculum sp.]HJJ57823.1 nuclease-related domain-containing protein [Methanocorpusculum sp.]
MIRLIDADELLIGFGVPLLSLLKKGEPQYTIRLRTWFQQNARLGGRRLSEDDNHFLYLRIQGELKTRRYISTVEGVSPPQVVITAAGLMFLDESEQKYDEWLAAEKRRKTTAADIARSVAGVRGEADVFNVLQTHLDGYFHLCRNLQLTSADGRTHAELDAVLMHTNGIFVFESKVRNGDVFGKQFNPNWQFRPESGKIIPFKNPLIQNEQHVKLLVEKLQIPFGEIYSVIVFSRYATLHLDCRLPSHTIILKQSQIAERIQNILDRSKIRRTEDEIDALYAARTNPVPNELKR